jgi:hypothetical protein
VRAGPRRGGQLDARTRAGIPQGPRRATAGRSRSGWRGTTRDAQSTGTATRSGSPSGRGERRGRAGSCSSVEKGSARFEEVVLEES